MSSASSFYRRLPLPLAIALALTGVPAIGATIAVEDAEGRSFESAGTSSDSMVADDAAAVAPQASEREKAARRGTVRIETPHRAEATEKAAGPRRASPAQMVFIDPATGEFTSSPPPDEQMFLQRFPDSALDTSAEGLEVVTHPDGSMSVDLQGRFQSRVYVITDETGKTKLTHQPNASSGTIPSPADSVHPNRKE